VGERFGNYEIMRKLASGGMAEVLLAKQRSFGGFERLVCLKRILPHLSRQEDFLKMFQDEARIAANLIHPNIAQIYDIAQEAESYFIAMEYVRGEDLRRVYNQEVGRGKTIPREIAAQVAMGAAAGLDYAHRQQDLDGRPLGIVHRDISPQNILVTYDGFVKLIDFGVAKAAGKLIQTRSGVLKGKYSYMSPEQASGDPVDGRSDIFALGITLYEITCGTRLFKKENELETLHAVIACNVVPPHEIVPGYDRALEAIIMKALAYDPEQRYTTAGELERDLEQYLIARGHPTSASHLATFMHDLFAEKLADEALFGGPPWNEPATQSRAAKHRREKLGAEPAAPARGSSAEAAPNAPAAPGALDNEATVHVAPQPPDLPADPAGPQQEAEPSVDSAWPEAERSGGDWRLHDDAEDRTVSKLLPAAGDPSLGEAAADRAPLQDPVPTADLAPLLAAAVPSTPDASEPPDAVGTAAPPAHSAAHAGPPLHAEPLNPQGPWRWLLLGAAVAIVGGGGLIYRRQHRAVTGPSVTAMQKLPAEDPGDVQQADGDDSKSDAGNNRGTRARSTPSAAALASSAATLTITAPLPLEVSLGNRQLGNTPITGASVPPGTYRLRLHSDRWGLQVRRSLRLEPAAAVNLDLREEMGSLALTGKPWAWVRLGTTPAAETPLRLNLLAGQYTLVFECPNGQRKTQRVDVAVGKLSTAHVDCTANN
jgi:predicted Ser/Thr protein kinase